MSKLSDPDQTYERTFEKSWQGDMTKLSFELDHEMRCLIDSSSSILRSGKLNSPVVSTPDLVLVQLVNECGLHDLGLLRARSRGRTRRTSSSAVRTVRLTVLCSLHILTTSILLFTQRTLSARRTHRRLRRRGCRGVHLVCIAWQWQIHLLLRRVPFWLGHRSYSGEAPPTGRSRWQNWYMSRRSG